MLNAECQHSAFEQSLSPGSGEEMLRRIVCGSVLAAILALASACGNTTTVTTPTTTVPTTETFSGLLNPVAAVVASFITHTGGTVTATLTSIGPDATQTVGFSLGTFNASTNVCTVAFDNPAAQQAAVFTTTASTTGFYCIRLYDNGSVASAAAAG